MPYGRGSSRAPHMNHMIWLEAFSWEFLRHCQNLSHLCPTVVNRHRLIAAGLQNKYPSFEENSKKEIRTWHSGFLKDCPSGKLYRSEFTKIYVQENQFSRCSEFTTRWRIIAPLTKNYAHSYDRKFLSYHMNHRQTEKSFFREEIRLHLQSKLY